MFLNLCEKSVQILMCRQNHWIGFYFIKFKVIGSFALNILYLGVDFLGMLCINKRNRKILLNFGLKPGNYMISLKIIFHVVLNLEVHCPLVARYIEFSVLNILFFEFFSKVFSLINAILFNHTYVGTTVFLIRSY